MELRRIADQMIDCLKAAGADTFFGVPGGSVVPFYDALYERPELKLVCPKHEAGAMFAAAAYARSSNKLAVVLVTSGPGLLNTMTGLATAHLDGAPVLLIAGDVATTQAGRNALQDGSAHGLNVKATTAHVTRGAFEIANAGSALPTLKRAIALAMSGRRGPVVVNVPLDVASAQHPVTRWASIADAASALDGAERIAILAGSGARKGAKQLRELAEHLQAGVMTTPKAKGVFPESHALSLGVFGHGGHPSATAYLDEGVDTLLVVGSSLNDPATDGWSKRLATVKAFIQIDVDEAQIGKNYTPTHVVIGDCEGMLAQLCAQTRKATKTRQLGIKYHKNGADCTVGDSGLITPERALTELSAMLPNAIFTIDIGEHLIFGTHYLKVNDPDGFMAMTGLASMGTSIGAAVGAQLAHPGRKVVAVCGDGCFVMALNDVATAAQENLPIIVAVLNDERYGMVELGTTALYKRSREYPLGPVDVVATARGLGAEAQQVTKPDQLSSILSAHAKSTKPLVIDIRIDRSSRMARSARFDSLLQSGRIEK